MMLKFSKTAARLAGAVALIALSLVQPGRAVAADDAGKPVRALLVIGGGFHDYAHQKDIITKGLSAGGKIEVTVAYDASTAAAKALSVYSNPDWSKGFDVVIHDECTADVKDLALINDVILKPHREGLPAIVLHCGMHSYRTDGWNVKGKGTPWMEFTGLQTTGHGAQIPIAVTFIDKESPVTKGLGDWTTIKEELYNNFAGDLMPTAHALGRGKQKAMGRNGEERVDDTIVVWTNMYNQKTRVFCTTLGHNNETISDPKYVDLLSRGILWATGRSDAKAAAAAAPVVAPVLAAQR